MNVLFVSQFESNAFELLYISSSPRRLFKWLKFAKGSVQNDIDVGSIMTDKDLVVKIEV